MTRRQFRRLLFICGLILLLPLTLYFFHFNRGFSNQSSEWRDFATFTTLFVALVNMILIGSISFTASQTTAIFQHRQLRPHIFLNEVKNKNLDFGFTSRIWQLVNSSNVTASTVLVRYKFNRNHDKWTKWINCFSLGSKDRLELYFVHFADVIEVCYTDVENRIFFLYSMCDWTGTETPISRHAFHSNLQEAIKKINANKYVVTNKIAEEDLHTFFSHLVVSGNKRNKRIKEYLEEYLA